MYLDMGVKVGEYLNQKADRGMKGIGAFARGIGRAMSEERSCQVRENLFTRIDYNFNNSTLGNQVRFVVQAQRIVYASSALSTLLQDG